MYGIMALKSLVTILPIDHKFHDGKGCLFWFSELSPMPTAIPETECILNKCLSHE